MTARGVHAVACWLCLLSVSYGHGIAARRVEGGVGVVATYDDGSPVSFSEAKVFAPAADDEPALSGMTDRNGCFMFRPDTNGTWKVTVDDGMGHAVTETIPFQDRATPLGRDKTGMSKRHGVVTGLALIFGLFGWGAFLRLKALQGRKDQR